MSSLATAQMSLSRRALPPQGRSRALASSATLVGRYFQPPVVEVDFVAPEASGVEWFVESVEALVRLLELPANWDSYGGLPISLDAVSRAAEILADVMSPGLREPWIVPLSSGGVQLEWRSSQQEIEIEIPPDDGADVAVFIVDRACDLELEISYPAATAVLGKTLRELGRG